MFVSHSGHIQASAWLSCRASDKCQREKRKTINGDDLLWAMTTLGFEDSIDVLRIYLSRYREVAYPPLPVCVRVCRQDTAYRQPPSRRWQLLAGACLLLKQSAMRHWQEFH